MNGEVWADIVSHHDSKFHHMIDIACTLLIGLSIGGLFVYWQMASIPQTRVVKQIQLSPESSQSQPDTKKGTVGDNGATTTVPSQPKISEI